MSSGVARQAGGQEHGRVRDQNQAVDVDVAGSCADTLDQADPRAGRHELGQQFPAQQDVDGPFNGP